MEATHSSALSASSNRVRRHRGSRPLQPSCVFITCLTSLGLPGRDGGGVLRRRGGRALPLPLLHPGSLCLHCHAVCHSQGMETNCLQVSSFSACLPERPHFLVPQPPLCSSTHRMSQPERACVCVCVCEYFLQLHKRGQMFCYQYKFSCECFSVPSLNKEKADF